MPKDGPHLIPRSKTQPDCKDFISRIMRNEKINYNPPRFAIKNEIELWWDMEIHTVTEVKKNQPDIVLWNHDLKTCQIIETTIPIDTNLKDAYHQMEINIYRLLQKCKECTVTISFPHQLLLLEHWEQFQRTST